MSFLDIPLDLLRQGQFLYVRQSRVLPDNEPAEVLQRTDLRKPRERYGQADGEFRLRRRVGLRVAVYGLLATHHGVVDQFGDAGEFDAGVEGEFSVDVVVVDAAVERFPGAPEADGEEVDVRGGVAD